MTQQYTSDNDDRANSESTFREAGASLVRHIDTELFNASFPILPDERRFDAGTNPDSSKALADLLRDKFVTALVEVIGDAVEPVNTAKEE